MNIDIENQAKIQAVINAHGGTSALARKLDKSRSVIDSWRARGVVPSWALLKHPYMFKGIKDWRVLKEEAAKNDRIKKDGR